MTGSPTRQTWVPGLLVGRYRLLRELAGGGMAEIWLAHQPGPRGFAREVVIKRIIPSNGEHGPDFERMFFDEARLASQLTHPNIVQVYEFDEFEGAPYLVMEYLAGESLSKVAREHANRGTLLVERQAVAIIQRCAEGLGFAHRKVSATGEPLHVVHRDVSPQNVFVTYDGLVKVLDFGIASAVGRSTKTSTGVVKGKVAYMAPEQADGAAGPGSDVFSLGVMLFELLSGQRFYAGLDDLQVFKRLLAETTPFEGPASVRADVPASLDAIVRKMLARDPAARFRDGAEAATALAGWLRSSNLEVGAAQLGQMMTTLFSHRQREQQEFLSSVQAGLIPEAHTPSQPGTFPGKTPGRALEPEAATLQSSSRQVRSRLDPRWSVAMVSALVVIATVAVVATRPAPESRPTLAARPVEPATAQGEPSAGTPPLAAELPAKGPEPSSRPAETPADAGPAAAPPRAEPRLARMKLSLDTTPWTRVFLGRRELGQTPLFEVPLPPGAHNLRLVNETLGIDTTVEIEGRPGEHVVKHFSP